MNVIVEFCKQHRRIIEDLLSIDGYQFDIASVHSDESHNRHQTKQYVKQLKRGLNCLYVDNVTNSDVNIIGICYS